jgi:phosphonate transport system substrate-binding protein
MRFVLNPALLACSLAAACGSDPTAPAVEASEAAAAPVPVIERLRLSGIPDSDKEKLTKQYEVVTSYLATELGIPVEYVHAPDYAAAVQGLASNKLDLVWLGGVTAVQAERETAGQARFVAAREEDLRFKSYFIAHRALVDDGTFTAVATRAPGTLADLAKLKPLFAERTFTFGAKASTSGHIMPRHFLESPEVEFSPETGFVSAPGFQVQGGHSATLQQVASGAYDLGVLNYTNWEKADAATQANAPVIFVTPEYVDYCFVAHARLGEALVERLRAALVALDPADPAEKGVLDVFSTTRFVPADPKAWDGIRAVLESGKERGILD